MGVEQKPDVGDVLRFTVFRSIVLEYPSWGVMTAHARDILAYDQGQYGQLTLVCGPFEQIRKEMLYPRATFVGWAFGNGHATPDWEQFDVIDPADVPDEYHVAIAKLVLLGRTN